MSFYFNLLEMCATVRVIKRCKPFNYTTDIHRDSESGVCRWVFFCRPRPGPGLVPVCMHEYMNALNSLCRHGWVCVCEMRDVPVIPSGRQLACSPVVRHEAQSKHNGSWKGQSASQSVCQSISYCCSFFFFFSPHLVFSNSGLFIAALYNTHTFTRNTPHPPQTNTHTYTVMWQWKLGYCCLFSTLPLLISHSKDQLSHTCLFCA